MSGLGVLRQVATPWWVIDFDRWLYPGDVVEIPLEEADAWRWRHHTVPV